MTPERESRINGNMDLARRLLKTARDELSKLEEKLTAHGALMEAARKAHAERRPQLDQELKTLAEQWDGWKHRPPSSTGQ